MDRIASRVVLAAVLLLPAASHARSPWLAAPDTSRIDSHLGVGALAYYPMYFERPYLGWEAYWTLRPSAAKYFYAGFEPRNVGLEVNLAFVDLTSRRGWVDASVVFHKYLSPRPGRTTQDAAFVGGGIGIVGVKWDSDDVRFRDVSFVVEMGYEYKSFKRVVITFKAQARYLEAGPINFNGGGFVVTAGWQRD